MTTPAIERSCRYKPELRNLLYPNEVVNREPGRPTRQDGTEPGKTTRMSPNDLMNAYAARFPRLRTGKDNH